MANVSGATVYSGGSGGTNGTQTVSVIGGSLAAGGSPAQFSVTVSGGTITAVLSMVYDGDYIDNAVPANPASVTGANLSGAALSLQIAPLSTDNFLM